MRSWLFRLVGLSLVAGVSPAWAAPLTLAEAVSAALSANRTLIAAKLAEESEVQGLERARSEFDIRITPTLSLGHLGGNVANTGANHSLGVNLSKKFEFGTQLTLGPSYNQSPDDSRVSFNVSLRQPILRGLGVDEGLDGLHLAEHAVATAGRRARQANIDIALDTLATYHEAVAHQRLLALNQDLRERLRRHALLAKNKEKVGLASPMDTYRAEIRLKDVETQLDNARNTLAHALDRLKLLMNLPLERPLEVVAWPLPPHPPGDLEQKALEHRLDLAQLRADLTEAQRLERLARARLRPDLNLIAQYGQFYTTDPFLTQSLPSTQQQWSVYLQASTDLHRSAEKEALRRADLRVETLRLSFDDRVAEVRRQIRQARLQLEEEQNRIALREAQIRAAEGKLALAETKFTHNLASNQDIIEAEVELQRARENLIVTENAHAVSRYRLWASIGLLLEELPWKAKP